MHGQAEQVYFGVSLLLVRFWSIQPCLVWWEILKVTTVIPGFLSIVYLSRPNLVITSPDKVASLGSDDRFAHTKLHHCSTVHASWPLKKTLLYISPSESWPEHVVAFARSGMGMECSAAWSRPPPVAPSASRTDVSTASLVVLVTAADDWFGARSPHAIQRAGSFCLSRAVTEKMRLVAPPPPPLESVHFT